MGAISSWSPASLLLCKALNTLFNYFMACTYFWMLCEGAYLFAILVVTFVSERKALRAACALGWGAPALLVAVYAVLRATVQDGAAGGDDGEHEL